jgi:hypothetical protein
MEKIKNKCVQCGSLFESESQRSKFCSIKCRTEYRRVNRLLKGVENQDYIICKWDGKFVGKYMSEHIKKFHKSKTIEQYQSEFPGALIIAPVYKDKISKNSGKHMKTEKYKKMFLEKIKGDKNPNHKSNTTKEQRQLCSKYSRVYWEKNFPNLTEIEITEKVTEFALKSQLNRLTETQLEYWIAKGYSEEDAKQKLKERQTTFSKEICIEKYGEKEGLKKWLNRQEKWQSNYTHSNFSKISQKLFKSIYKKIKNDYHDIYFAELDENKNIDTLGKNHEYVLNLNNKLIKPDFFIKDINKIIEFDGIYWHRKNPENKKREYLRDVAIIESGFDVLHINENDYKNNPEKEIKKCLEFIND